MGSCLNNPFVIESYSDDTGNWYRVYSDGWIEQGGRYNRESAAADWIDQINFLKPMASNYTVTVTDADTTNKFPRLCSAKELNSTGFKITSSWPWGRDNKSKTACWFVCGYGA